MKKFTWLFSILILLTIGACKQATESKTTPDIAEEEEQLIQRGKEITQATFKALSQELQRSMKEGGVEEAISYCNLNALPLTAQLSKEHKAVIKRSSLKYRNPKNAPTQEEVDILNEFQTQLENGGSLSPKLLKEKEHHVFYAPIITQELCLKCHGPKENIPEYDQILSKYPEDLATGYTAGDLRGMWTVTLLSSRK